jgi:hypothetical protein
MGIEGQNHRLTASRVGKALGRGHQGLVTAMHAIEVADGDRGRAQGTP